MPQVHYPFIDIAVHPAVRTHFAAGDAVVLFSRDMNDVLWANGEGARLFGHREIYDLLEGGPERGGVAFRQLAAAAAQLSLPGDKRGFAMRITSGFKSSAVQAEVNLVVVGRDEAVMFSAPAANGKAGLSALLSGFDDPDTHMAVLGRDGEVLVASPGFAHLGVSPETSRLLINAVARSADGLVKRPVPSGAGYLPAAIGRLSDDLYLLFCVETSIGRMDAPEDRHELTPAVVEPVAEFLHEPEAETAEVDDAVVGDTGDETPAEDNIPTQLMMADAPVVEHPATEPSEFEEPVAVEEPEGQTEFASAASEQTEEAPVNEDESGISEIEEGAVEENSGDLAAVDGASAEAVEAASSDVNEAGEEQVAGTEVASAALEQIDETFAYADEAGISDIEEGAAEEDIGDLAAIDGVSQEEIEAASLDVNEIEEQVPETSIGSADLADASVEIPATLLAEVDSPELAADIAEAADNTAEVPEEFQESQSEEAATSEIPVQPEFDASQAGPQAEASDEVTGHDESYIGDEAADQRREPTELAADVAESTDSAEQAPEEFEEAQAQAEENEPEAVSEPELASEEPPIEAGHVEGFHFDRRTRPVRFVWKLDANGTFAEVSDEFARTVGPHSGNIVGQSFRDLAALFDLDPGQQITGLLDRRDTWSGRTIKWPVEGTDLVVPVDLAALPTYSRNREFDGFRGFGIIRVGDAESDPNGFGLTISPATASAERAVEDETSEDAKTPTDAFRGEVPALDIVSTPLANFSDKIIQLEERRAKATRDGLSASEQAALKEIARQLEPFGKRPNEDILKSTSGLLQTEDSEEGADDRFDDALVQDGDAVQATDDEAGDFEDDGAELDEQGVQTLFEDLGTGPGLTAYALDQVPMAILIHAGDRLIEANSEFHRLTGYESINDLDRAGGLDALITRREGPDAGVYLVRSDGMQVLVSARLQSVRYEGSSALMLALTPAAGTLAAVTTDPQIIGESDAARRLSALKVEVDELHSILETATDGVIVLDTEGRIRSMNRSASALFNFDDNETRGKPFAMLFAHESQKSVQDYLAGLAGHGVASVLNDGRELIGREASGGFIPLFMTMGRMPGSNSYCAVIRDITQWKRSEEELRTAKRAAETANQHKSDFLARVSHEIRTPLNAIIGFSDMIANEHFGPAGHPRYVEYAADIGRSGRHVLDIVNDLLDISKIEAGEMDLEFAAVGINECISEAVSLVQPQANAQRVIIRTSLSQSVPDVVADLRSIKQIALNILANAIRYTPSGGQIVVSTAYESSGSVTLRIRDTGVGMSKAELDQAMKPFGQVSSGTRQRGDGTGLGLPLTRAMTEANRATFSIHSAPNEGTLVEITFPPQRVLAD
jgi:PAS domain S-box-containing protein